MSQAKFVVPASLTLRQTLNLLYSIVHSQFENCQEVNKKADNGLANLNELVKALAGVLAYLHEGLAQIENFYKVKNIFFLKSPDILAMVNDLRILDHDIKMSKQEAEKKLTESSEGKNQTLSSGNSHFSLSKLAFEENQDLFVFRSTQG